MIFDNFTIAECRKSGIDFYTSKSVIAQNMGIIGMTHGNRPARLNGARGAKGPSASSWKMTGIRFHRFPSSMVVFQPCSTCNFASFTAKRWYV